MVKGWKKTNETNAKDLSWPEMSIAITSNEIFTNIRRKAINHLMIHRWMVRSERLGQAINRYQQIDIERVRDCPTFQFCWSVLEIWKIISKWHLFKFRSDHQQSNNSLYFGHQQTFLKSKKSLCSLSKGFCKIFDQWPLFPIMGSHDRNFLINAHFAMSSIFWLGS